MDSQPPCWILARPVACLEPGDFDICLLEVLGCHVKEPRKDAGETTGRERRRRLKEDG